MTTIDKFIVSLIVAIVLGLLGLMVQESQLKREYDSWNHEKQERYKEFSLEIDQLQPNDFIVLRYSYTNAYGKLQIGHAMYQSFSREDGINTINLKLVDSNAHRAEKYISYPVTFISRKMELFSRTSSIIRRKNSNSGWYQEAEHYYLQVAGTLY